MRQRIEHQRFQSSHSINCEQSWLTSGIDQNGLDQISKWCEEKLAVRGSEVTTSKLRKFYGEVKRIQSLGIDTDKGKQSFMMLKPKLAYAVGRENKNHTFKELYKFLEKAINYVEIDKSSKEELKKRFNNFTHIFESIVAYHKYHGGKD